MTPEQWQRVREVLADALELRSEDRPAYLDGVCSADDSVRREVERLLASSNEARSSFLQSSAFHVGLAPGSKLGDYEVQRLIGSGGMGQVYRAHDTRLGRDVAIKVLPAVVTHDPDRLRRFEQEARAAAALNHPNILAVHQMGTYQGAPYLVSELLEGCTLRELLVRGPLLVRKAMDYGVQISRGLAAAHQKGITHRDLKPENLFVTKDGRAKILDFGLAKLTQRKTIADQSAPTVSVETEPGVVMGTVGYMAPEQVRGEAAGHCADIFSLGAILYEMLTDKRAFQKPTSAETINAVLNEDPPGISQIIPSINPALERMVHRCLEKNPDQRFQSASDLAFALEALSDSGVSLANAADARRPNRVRPATFWWGGSALILLLVGFGIFKLVSTPKIPVNPSSWVQITNFPDSVTQPALSPDGRLLTFVHGPYTFAGPGQIYVKMLPRGEPVQLTRDSSQKMSPAFSPDGSRIAYTTVDFDVQWDTWALPVIGGEARRWLPNASGLVWYGERKILFSEMKNKAIHMALVSADEGRAEEHDVYVPASDIGMAHRSSPSPDGRWAIVIEMDGGVWLPCKLVSLDGSSQPRLIGPAAGACTSADWSPDGKWMYFASAANGAFHIWRQRFPNSRPEQITSGPTEEEGVAISPDGGSLITAVGSRQSSVWVHDSKGKRQVSLEGFSYDPKFTRDGKWLCYRILKGAVPNTGASELHVVDIGSGRDEPLIPGFTVVGPPHRTYDISRDGQQVVLTGLDSAGKHRLWLVPFDHRSPPRQIPNVEGDNPLFSSAGEILFRSSGFAYRVREDGTGFQKLIDEPTVDLYSISPDRQWLVAKVAQSGGLSTLAVPLHQGSTVRLISSGGITRNSNEVYWSGDGAAMYIKVPATQETDTGGRTYVVPVPHGRSWPGIPAGGVQSEAGLAKLPGARLLDEFDEPGPTAEIYTFVRMTVQRNLFRVPLP
jgi:serine/threonine protein kinase